MYSLRAPRKKKKTGRRVFLGALPIVLLLGVAANFFRPLPAATATPEALTSKIDVVRLDWPAVGSSAMGAVGYGVLDAHGTASARPIASIAKLMTALALMEKKPFKLGQQGETYTVTQHDVDLYNSYYAQGGASTKVTIGLELTEYQMLQAMLLPSSNNMADSAAIWAYGSIDAYLAHANQMAREFGFKHMVLADDASGMSPQSVATARELVLLGERVMANPVLANIVGQKSAIIPGAGVINSANARLGYNNIIGIKTGLTDQAGGCFLFAATHTLAGGEKVTLVGVIMGARQLTDAFDGSTPLLNSAAPHFKAETPIKAGQKLASYATAWGASSDVVAAKDVTIVSWHGVPLQQSIKLNNSGKARVAGDTAGNFSLHSGTMKVSSDVLLKSDIEAAPPLWRLTRLD